jgi:hypothetical protein
MPSPGRHTSGMAVTSASDTVPDVNRVWRPAGLPESYHPVSRGQSYPRPSPITSMRPAGGIMCDGPVSTRAIVAARTMSPPESGLSHLTKARRVAGAWPLPPGLLAP